MTITVALSQKNTNKERAAHAGNSPAAPNLF